jgi:hypothetical protein
MGHRRQGRSIGAAVTVAVSLAAVCIPSVAAQGWYLVGPPGHRLPKNILDFQSWPQGSWSEVRADLLKKLPLSEWATYQAFDTAAACEDERASRIAAGNRMLEKSRGGPLGPGHSNDLDIAIYHVTYWSLAMCLASDDVRLVPKK